MLGKQRQRPAWRQLKVGSVRSGDSAESAVRFSSLLCWIDAIVSYRNVQCLPSREVRLQWQHAVLGLRPGALQRSNWGAVLYNLRRRQVLYNIGEYAVRGVRRRQVLDSVGECDVHDMH
jgi:hypothetical protein